MFSARGFQAHETLSKKASGKRMLHGADEAIVLTETVPCSCDARRTSKKTSEKLPGNLGLAMKELDAAEVRAVIFFLFFF